MIKEMEYDDRRKKITIILILLRFLSVSRCVYGYAHVNRKTIFTFNLISIYFSIFYLFILQQ